MDVGGGVYRGSFSGANAPLGIRNNSFRERYGIDPMFGARLSQNFGKVGCAVLIKREGDHMLVESAE